MAEAKRVEDANSGKEAEQTGSKNQTASSTDQVVNKVENALGVETGTTKDIYKQAKNTAGQAFEKVSEKANEQIGEQKETLARGLSSVADNIRQMGENLRGSEDETPIANITAKYGDSLAKQVEQVSDYLEKKDLREVLRDVESFARRNPAVFLGAAFALGLLAARFLKSSGTPRNLKGESQFREDGLHLPDDLDEPLEIGDEPSEFKTPGRNKTISAASDEF